MYLRKVFILKPKWRKLEVPLLFSGLGKWCLVDILGNTMKGTTRAPNQRRCSYSMWAVTMGWPERAEQTRTKLFIISCHKRRSSSHALSSSTVKPSVTSNRTIHANRPCLQPGNSHSTKVARSHGVAPSPHARHNIEEAKVPATISHRRSIQIQHRLWDAYGTLHSSSLKWPLSLAKLSSHLQYLWIIQNDVSAADFISAL